MHSAPHKDFETLRALNPTSRFWSFPGLHEFKEEYVKQKERRDLYFEKRELERLIREKDDTFFDIDELKNLLLNYEVDSWTKNTFLDWYERKDRMTHEEWAVDMQEWLEERFEQTPSPWS